MVDIELKVKMVVGLVLEPNQMVTTQLLEEEAKVEEREDVEDHHPEKINLI